MKKLKLGQEIEIQEPFKKILKEMNEQNAANMKTINDLSLMMNQRKTEIWELIKEILPETKEYNCSYNSETGTVNIISEK